MRYALLFFAAICLSACRPQFDKETQYQQDTDGIRLEHLVYWTGLIEEFHDNTGYYPLQNRVNTSSQYDTGLVRIATQKQQRFFNKTNPDYKPDLENNRDNFFQDFTTAEFVTEIEKGLGREIDEKYDVAAVPTVSIIWYNYFVSKNGYLMWVPCLSCGVTSASTLTMNGKSPTVNIGSEDMIEGVPKAMTRDKMLAHPDFKRWINYPFNDEAPMRALEAANFKDSKKLGLRR